mgnify:CR=1 FL=1
MYSPHTRFMTLKHPLEDLSPTTLSFNSSLLLVFLVILFIHSRECQLQDWPLHKLMCHADRVIIDDDGSVIPVGAAAVAEAEGGAVSPSAALDAAKAALPEVISQSEMNDNELFAMVVDKLQLQISPFAVMQVRNQHQLIFEPLFLSIPNSHTMICFQLFYVRVFTGHAGGRRSRLYFPSERDPPGGFPHHWPHPSCLWREA